MEITLHKFSENDVEERVRWINNPKVHRYMYFELPITISSTKRWLETVEENKKRIDFTLKNQEGRNVAMGGLININKRDQNAEFYIMVNPELQGKGYGLMAAYAIFNYGFSFYNLHKIYLYTDANNRSASNLYKKMNLFCEGTLRDQKRKEDGYLDRVIYSLLRPEWDKLNWKAHIENEV